MLNSGNEDDDGVAAAVGERESDSERGKCRGKK